VESVTITFYIGSLEDQSDLSLEPAYFKPKKKVKELPIE
jgi:hypothetical protein